MSASNITSDDLIRELCIITTRNDAGRHFTEWSDHYERLEAAGWIRIDRPVHEATGIPYSMDSWSVEVTEEGQEIVDAYPELHPDATSTQYRFEGGKLFELRGNAYEFVFESIYATDMNSAIEAYERKRSESL